MFRAIEPQKPAGLVNCDAVHATRDLKTELPLGGVLNLALGAGSLCILAWPETLRVQGYWRGKCLC